MKIKQSSFCVLVDGGLSSWSSWSPCTKTCNATAFTKRERTCTNPSPKYGGRPCVGSLTEAKECGQQPCPSKSSTLHIVHTETQLVRNNQNK